MILTWIYHQDLKSKLSEIYLEEKLREEETAKAEHRKSTTWSLRSAEDGLEVRLID